MSVMTASALPPTPDVTATTSMTRTRTAAGGSDLRDGDVARAQIAAMQAHSIAGVIDSMPTGPTAPTASERARESEAPPRKERVPDSSKAEPTDASTARARAAEAELRAETAAYQGVKQAIDNSGAASERAAERREAARKHEQATETDEPDDRRRRDIRALRERTAEAIALARIENARAGVAAAADEAHAAAAEDVRRANELAARIAAENARQGGSRALDATAGQTALDPEVAAAAVELARTVGAITERATDGRLTVTVGDRALVDRAGVHPLELRHVDPADTAARSQDGLARIFGGGRGQSADAASTAPRNGADTAARLEAVWPNRRVADGVGGALAGHLSAVNTVISQVAVVVDEIATVARAEAAMASLTSSAQPLVDRAAAAGVAGAAGTTAGVDDSTALAGGGSLSGSATPVAGANLTGAQVAQAASGAPTASDLLDELGTSLGAAAADSARRQDVASAVAAITAGPPTAFFAAVVASTGETAPASPVQIAQRASQQFVSDLQQLTASATATEESATGLAVNTPFVPVRVTSSDPSLVRVDTPWPTPGPVGSAPAEQVPALPFDADAIASPLSLELSVVSVAHGNVVMSRGGVAPHQDLANGGPLSLVFGTSASAQPGAAAEPAVVVGEVTVPAPVTLEAVAETINALTAESGATSGGGGIGGVGGTVSAGVQQGANGSAHLILESAQGAAWAAARLPDGTSRDILGGFSLLAPQTDSLVISTSAGIGWTGISSDRSLDGPLPGLGLTLQPGSEGQQVTLTLTPATGEVTDSVDELVAGLRSTLAAAGAAEAGPSGGSAAGALSAAAGFTGATVAVGDVAALASGTPNAPGAAASPASATGSPSPADNFGLPTADGHSAGAAPAVPASDPLAVVAASAQVTPLAGDPAIMDLAAAFVAAISGVKSPDATGTGGAAAGASTALAVGAGTQMAAAAGIPGLSVDVSAAGLRRIAFDREEFARALADEPSGTRSAVRAAAAEVAGVAREALDGRVGLLAVRLHTELTAAREVDIQSAAPDWGKEQREIEATRRADALTALLDRLHAESKWLGGQLA